jgi:hypothetical protein
MSGFGSDLPRRAERRAPALGGRAWVRAALGGAAAALAIALPCLAWSELTGDSARAARAEAATLELSTEVARGILDGADPADGLLAVERARLALYEGRCAEAARILEAPEHATDPRSAPIAAVSRGCERSMAGSVVVEDERGAWLRVQDDADRVLAPWIFDTIAASRGVFERELGVTLPSPVRVELVRDQRALSMMTGLPLEAARTTGTIGIAKWGRVIMVSPRAAPKGYPYLDTLSHELAHLALTRGSADRAPLWLQEGVARSLETRWREPLPFDGTPSADALAAFGLQQGIGPDIDKIGPSIALLPSADEAQITYAKVESFIAHYARAAGDGAMAKLLAELRSSSSADAVVASVERASGEPFARWVERWRAAVAPRAEELDPADRPGAPPEPGLKEARKRVRLGQLLLGRDHDRAARIELEQGRVAMPRGALVRALLAAAERGVGDLAAALSRVAEPKDVAESEARWWSLRAELVDSDRERSRAAAVSLAPYDPAVACDEKDPPALPADPRTVALCEAARVKPRAR